MTTNRSIRSPILLTVLSLAALACSMPLFARPTATPETTGADLPTANPATITTSTPSGLIVYTCFLDGFDQICLMNADGSNQRRLTDVRATDFYPSLAPGSQAIVFSSRRDGPFNIYRMGLDGTAVTRLTAEFGDNYAPAVSPDGTRIVFVSTFKGNQDVWLMNADGSNPVQVTDWESNEYDPTWSPDGSQIAFTSDRTGTHELYVVDATGSNPRQVTGGSDQREGGRNDWSPDGLSLAFYAGPVRDKNLFLVPAACAGCTADRFARLTNGGNNKAPSFSSDGGWITFAAGNATGDKNNDIFIMRTDGSERRQLTNRSYAEYQPRWGR